ncbi:MAG: glycoside hydrolase family 140 protein [Woeseiaceae bacterium]
MLRLVFAVLALVVPAAVLAQTPPLTVSEDGRSLRAGDHSFFWLGDTGWLMLSRLDRAETEYYLRTRSEQGFNVIQVMILHKPDMATVDGTPALIDGDPARPYLTPGNDPDDRSEYDYWDHLDWALQVAERYGIYLALVPAWGDIADDGILNEETAKAYGDFLGKRYRDRTNIVWINGGDTLGASNSRTWSVLGRTLKRYNPDRLMTFHPRGRTDSSWWYHRAPWLDLNMFQSGHSSYAQDPDGRGEDNWSYVLEDWARVPAKPVIDGEPSYENMPHGLDYPDAPRWQAADVRRYVWWAVLSGACGHTYGDNDVMQMLVPGRYPPAFSANQRWDEALKAPGAGQMRYVKELMLSLGLDGRVPDAGLVVDNGTGYDRIPVLRGPDYVLAYVYNGREFTLRLGAIAGEHIESSWYSPRDGEFVPGDSLRNSGEVRFDPPGDAAPGNDWVLMLRMN